MQRSWAYAFYDIALFAVLLLPLALATAVKGDRDQAALVYVLLLVTVTLGSLLVARFSTLSLRAYWRSLKQDAAKEVRGGSS